MRFSRMLTKKYAVEFSSGHDMVHTDKDPVTGHWIGVKPPPFEFDFILQHDDGKTDHAPAVHLYVEVFGRVLCDFSVYSVNHSKIDLSRPEEYWACPECGCNELCPECVTWKNGREP